MKDLELTIRIKNNRIKERREALGLTQAQLAFECGWKPELSLKNIQRGGGTAYIGGYESMRLSPTNARTGAWNKSALRIARFFGVEPEEIWPDAILAVKKTTSVTKMDVLDMARILRRTDVAGELGTDLEEEETTRAVSTALATLKPKERKVIEARFGIGRDAETLEEVGTRFKISRERVRQIESKALRKLRHPARSGLLRQVAS